MLTLWLVSHQPDWVLEDEVPTGEAKERELLSLKGGEAGFTGT